MRISNCVFRGSSGEGHVSAYTYTQMHRFTIIDPHFFDLRPTGDKSQELRIQTLWSTAVDSTQVLSRWSVARLSSYGSADWSLKCDPHSLRHSTWHNLNQHHQSSSVLSSTRSCKKSHQFTPSSTSHWVWRSHRIRTPLASGNLGRVWSLGLRFWVWAPAAHRFRVWVRAAGLRRCKCYVDQLYQNLSTYEISHMISACMWSFGRILNKAHFSWAHRCARSM